MSAPGFTNLNTSVGYSLNSTPNGGAASPYQNGKTGRGDKPGCTRLAYSLEAAVYLVPNLFM